MIFWLPALLPLAITSANLVFWRRLEPTASPPGRLSVLIPARNEGANVDACLAAAVATEAHEIVVCDDASTDDTAVRVLAWSRRDPRIRLLTGSGPPTGWLGKAAACERLRCDATGDWLLFIDADVRLAPDAFARLGSVRPVDLLSVVPTQEVVTFGERLVLPLLHLTYVSWLFLPAIRWSIGLRRSVRNESSSSGSPSPSGSSVSPSPRTRIRGGSFKRLASRRSFASWSASKFLRSSAK